MSEDRFRFDFLNKANTGAWLQAAGACSYAPFSVFDKVFLERAVREDRFSLSAIVFDNKNGRPVAIFPAELYDMKARMLFRIRVLRSAGYGGLLVADDYLQELGEIKRSFCDYVVAGRFARSGVDYIEVRPPPMLMIEKPSLIYGVLPFYKSHAEINSILYTDLRNNFIDNLKYNVKREALKGVEALKNMRIVRKEDNDAFGCLKEMESQKAKTLKIDPIPDEDLKNILKSDHLTTLIAVSGGNPLAVVTYSYRNRISTLNYNASSQEGKRLFINKGLMYLCMQECRDKQADYFVLGSGWEHSKNADARRQLERMTFFKRSFSTNEVATYRFISPLTIKGAIAATINDISKRRVR